MFGIAVSWRFPGGFVMLPRNGILARSVRHWELPNFASGNRRRRMAWEHVHRPFSDGCLLPQRTKRISDHFPFDGSNLHCLPVGT
jgi:hypothetical protein